MSSWHRTGESGLVWDRYFLKGLGSGQAAGAPEGFEAGLPGLRWASEKRTLGFWWALGSSASPAWLSCATVRV